MNKLILGVLVPFVFSGLSASAAPRGNELKAKVLAMGLCYTTKHTIKFFPHGKAALITFSEEDGANAYSNPYGNAYGNSYANPYTGEGNSYTSGNSYENAYGNAYAPVGPGEQLGEMTSWKVAGSSVYVLWPRPKYWAKLQISLADKTCKFGK